jgi:hypothetical protein
VTLDFLDARRRYCATIYRDGADAGFAGNPASVEIETRPVTSADTLALNLAPGGGQAIRFSTQRPRERNDGNRTGRGSPAAGELLADLEHVFRIPRDPVRLRAAERQRQPHLPDAGRRGRRHRGPVDRGAAHGSAVQP